MSVNFTQNEQVVIPGALSVPRFETYLNETGRDVHAALKLYEWNAQIAASFMFPLHLFEICVRNGAANAIESNYNATWPWAPAFVMSLPNPYPPNFSPQREILSVGERHRAGQATGKVIADLKFAFWVSMFTSRHEGRLWDQYIRREFPYAPAGLTVSEIRKKIYDATDRIRILRNRIAHHEPIYPRDLSLDYDLIREVVGFRCQVTQTWMMRTEEVSYMLATKP